MLRDPLPPGNNAGGLPIGGRPRGRPDEARRPERGYSKMSSFENEHSCHGSARDPQHRISRQNRRRWHPASSNLELRERAPARVIHSRARSAHLGPKVVQTQATSAKVGTCLRASLAPDLEPLPGDPLADFLRCNSFPKGPTVRSTRRKEFSGDVTPPRLNPHPFREPYFESNVLRHRQTDRIKDWGRTDICRWHKLRSHHDGYSCRIATSLRFVRY